MELIQMWYAKRKYRANMVEKLQKQAISNKIACFWWSVLTKKMHEQSLAPQGFAGF